MPLEFIPSARGNQKLCKDGYLYLKDKSAADGAIIWKCDQFYAIKCKARLYVDDDEITKSVGVHNHAPDIAKIKANKAAEAAKEKARTTQEATHLIVSEIAAQLTPAVQAKMPAVESLKRSIRRQRVIASNAPPNPTNLRDLQIPKEYRMTKNGENFLLYDSGPSETRMLIFGTKQNLQFLTQSNHLYADGTFKTVPPLFQQLYTIHGIRENKVFPAIFALLPSKSEVTYRRLFNKIQELQPDLNPESVMVDFENAAINALESCFVGVQCRGCFFHFTQCIYRSIQNNGLQQRYAEDEEFALKMRLLPALAFVPVEDVLAAFEHLINVADFPEEAQSVIDYFEDTWIGRPQRRNQRRNPKFPLILWNCYNAVVNGLPKTNNAVEGWHRSFLQTVGAQHPAIWKFIEALMKEQVLTELKIEQSTAGVQQPPKKKYRDCAARISARVEAYAETDLLTYLRAIAYNYRF